MRPRWASAAIVLGFVVPLIASGTVVRGQEQPSRQALLASPPLEHYLEALRQQAGIPGMSAAVVQDGEIVWERGFGFQNVEARIRATPDTPYLVGGLSQSIAAVLLLQCVEQRRIYLDDPVRRYGLDSLQEQSATLRHVLGHVSAGTPGTTYKFAPERYAQLSTVMEWCALGQPYRKSVAHRVLERLAMRDSVPGTDLRNPDVVPEGLFEPEALDRYASVLERVAIPYRSEGRNRSVRLDPAAAEGINAATGLVTTVRDLAQFEIALDSGTLLLNETRETAWSASPTTDGVASPAGLGWFVQRYRDEQIVWQFGHVPSGYSSMIIKVPSRGITFILLANSAGLAGPFDLPAGDITRSLFAMLFLRSFL